MGAFVVRALPSGLIIAAMAMVARRSPAAGAVIASLPLASVSGMVWLRRDTQDPVTMAAYAEATFWYILPSLPMFPLITALLRHGVQFSIALLAGCALTFALYLVTATVAARFGVTL